MTKIFSTPFSVLMSIYHKEKADYFDQAMCSIWDQQDLRPNEIILVKDGPLTPDLDLIIERWTEKLPGILKIIPLATNVGLGKALNIGISHCQFEIIARMDTDDISVKTRFLKQINFLKKHPDVVLLGSNIQEFEHTCDNITGERKVPISHNDICRYAKSRSPFNHPTVIYRKNAILSVNAYQHHLYMEDYNLWLRIIAAKFKVANLPDNLLKMRAGNEMLARRKGWIYVKGEWDLFKLKKSLNFQNNFTGFPIFIARALPRILPHKLLASIYTLIRKKI